MRSISRKRIDDWRSYQPDVHLPLVSSLVAKIPGLGGAVAVAFNRSTNGTVTDFEGVIKETRINEARFYGARRVENLIGTSSINIAAAGGWTVTAGIVLTAGQADPWGGTTASRLNIGTMPTAQDALANNSTRVSTENVFARKFLATAWVKGEGANIGKGVTLVCKRTSGTFAAAQVIHTLTAGWQRISTGIFTGIADNIRIKVAFYMDPATSTLATEVLIAGPMIEEVSGQANQNPSEYLTVGALASPFHGAGADGIRYFQYRNANTVSSNVITEARGVDLCESTCMRGMICENARTNLETNGLAGSAIGGTVGQSTTVLDRMGRYSVLYTEDTGPATAGHYTYLNSPAVTLNVRYTLSCYVKAGTATKCQLASTASAFALTVYANFDLVAGTILSSGVGAENPWIESAGDGWWRIGFTALSTGTGGGPGVIVGTIDSDTALRLPTFVGTGRTIYRSMGQHERGTTDAVSHVSTYVVTVAVAVARSDDTATYAIDYTRLRGSFTVCLGYYIDRIMPFADRRALGLTGNTTTCFQLVPHNNSATPTCGYFIGDGTTANFAGTGSAVAGQGYLGSSVRRKATNPLAISNVSEARMAVANNGSDVGVTQFSIGSVGGAVFAPVRNIRLWASEQREDVLRSWARQS